LWEGVQLVKARRDEGPWAQSGGFLSDGTDYGQGTATYWFHSALALVNAGVNLDGVAPLLRHVILAEMIYLLTPTGGGFATAGDVEDFSYNFGVEPQSFQLETADAGLLTMAAGALKRGGEPATAALALDFARTHYTDDADAGEFFRLLFDADGALVLDHRLVLTPTYFDSGMDVLYHRTSWSSDASFLMMRAGWDGVDHSRGDIGHFQLFRRGRWITHEAIGYDGPAATGAGHNVPLLALTDADPQGDQFHLEPAGALSGTRRLSSCRVYSYLAADLTGAYTSFHSDSRLWDQVERQLVWLKDADEDADDVIVVWDRTVPAAATSSTAVRAVQIHLDEAPAVTGTTVSAILGDQRLDVTALLPADAVVTVATPDGPPDGFPAEVYTHRVMVTPADPSQCDGFLTVLRAADSTAPNMAPELVTATDYVAAVIGDRAAIFPRVSVNDSPGPLSELDITLQRTAPVRVFVTGLTPGARHAVTAQPDAGSTSLHVSAGGSGFRADRGGVLAVLVGADGSIRQLNPLVIFADGLETADLSGWSR
jgi:hypothetical protein